VPRRTIINALTATSAAPLGYLGWDRKGKLGDLAIRQAYQQSLPGRALLALPCDYLEAERIVGTATAERLRPMRLLGGGTVLGRRHWRFVLSRRLQLASARPALLMRAGVEDPGFHGTYSGSDDNELRNWPPLLADFDRVTVRGPGSAELHADHGVDSKVVGDPALRLDPGSAAEPDEILGISLGFGNDLWSHDQLEVVERVAQAVTAILHSRRWRVRFLVVNARDLRWTREGMSLMAAAPAGYEVVTAACSEPFFAAVAPCLVIIGERVRSVILASAAGIPAVMLEYQPNAPTSCPRSAGRNGT
jgi:Polysaccharide pyruvyl transferase